jgi:hypothetical protein
MKKISKKDELAIRLLAFDFCQQEGWFDGETLETMQLTFENEIYWTHYYQLSLITYKYWKNAFKIKM